MSVTSSIGNLLGSLFALALVLSVLRALFKLVGIYNPIFWEENKEKRKKASKTASFIMAFLFFMCIGFFYAAAHAAPITIRPVDDRGNVQYHKPAIVVLDNGKAYKTDDRGNIRYDRPVGQIEEKKTAEKPVSYMKSKK